MAGIYPQEDSDKSRAGMIKMTAPIEKVIPFPVDQSLTHTPARPRDGRVLTHEPLFLLASRYRHPLGVSSEQPYEFGELPGKSDYCFITLHQDIDAFNRQFADVLRLWIPSFMVVESEYKSQFMIPGMTMEDWIVPHYNRFIAEMAHMEIVKAAYVAVINELPRFINQEKFLADWIKTHFRLDLATAFRIITDVQEQSAVNLEKLLAENVINLEILDQVGNDLTWNLANRDEKRRKRVLIIASREHRPPFQADYSPRQTFPDEDVDAVQQMITQLYKE